MDECVDMVRHHGEGVEAVSIATPQNASDESRRIRIAKVALAVSFIQRAVEPPGGTSPNPRPLPGREGTTEALTLTRLFVGDPLPDRLDAISGERIVEAEGHKVERAWKSPVRQAPAVTLLDHRETLP